VSGRSEIQRAIDFLSGPELEAMSASLPPRPDYEALARLARGLGHELSPGAIREAFRTMMRARRLGSRKPR
jgi:hypothetical protein